MNIVFMGTPQFAVESLRRLIECGHTISLVVTQPDKRGNRGKMESSAVKQFAVENEISCEQPNSIRNDDDFILKLKEINPEVIVVAAFGQILPKEVLDIPQYGCLNVHGSLLPELRGAAPMQYAILEGKEVTGVSIMQMNEGLDTGDVLRMEELRIDDMDITELSSKLSILGAKALTDTIAELPKGEIKAIPQDNSKATYAHIITKADGLTSFEGTAEDELNRMRAYKEWPVLHSYLNGKLVKFYDAEIVQENNDGIPGQISRTDRNSIIVNCGKNKLNIKMIQMQGKKAMCSEDFLRGHKLSNKDFFMKTKEEKDDK